MGKGDMRIRILNEIADGTYCFPTKCSAAIMIEDPIVIILSNYSIDDVYCNTENGTLKSRFNEVDVEFWKFHDEEEKE